MDKCPAASGIRISLDKDRRIFTPIDRASYKWEKQYATRTSVERVNSRLVNPFAFKSIILEDLKNENLMWDCVVCYACNGSGKNKRKSS